jgi:amino acid adenylation domain-containing protein
MTEDNSQATGLSAAQRARLLQHLRHKNQVKAQQQAIPRIDVSAPVPASFAQQRLWFLHQFAPDDPAYNWPACMRCLGQLQVDHLQHSLSLLIARHAILRTTFATIDGQPMQLIGPPAPLVLPVISLEQLTPDAQEAEIQHRVQEAARQPFDLSSGPLLRAQVLRLSPSEHVLVLFLHHIISDGWSAGILLRDTLTVYQALAAGQSAEAALAALPTLPIQYADYALWQRQTLQGESRARLLRYWQQKLQPPLPRLALPTDYPYPAQRRSDGDTAQFLVPTEAITALRQLVAEHDATLFMGLLALWGALLSRTTGQSDLLIGTPIAGRTRPEVAHLIGFFTNTLVLRLDLSGTPTFRELLTHVRQVCLAAYDHQELPFEQIVEMLPVERSIAETPVFQVVFALDNTPELEFEIPQLRLQEVSTPATAVPFDLMLTFREKTDAVIGHFLYRTDLFAPTTIERQIGHLLTLLDAVVADPDRAITVLPILTAAERRQILVEWNATATHYPPDQCVHELVAEQAARTPDAIAVAFEGHSLTYAALDARANQLAHQLQTLGVVPESRVAICLDRSLELVVGLLGILKAGGAYVPLDPAYPVERLQLMLADAQSPVLLTSAALTAHVATSRHSTFHVLLLDRDWTAIAAQPTTAPESPVTADNLAYMIYTSGSTGQPKGVLNTHQAIVNRLRWMQDTYQLGSHDRVLQKTPYSFDVSVWEFFCPLISGATLVVARPGGHQDPAYLVDLIVAERITLVHFVPSMLRLFLDEPKLDRISSVQRVICSGEALTLDLQQRFFERLRAELHNLYGPTEAAVEVSYWQCRRDSHAQSVPIGHPVANTQLYVLDNWLNPQPVGTPGELHIGGVQVGRGYLNRPALTAEKFIPDPFSGGVPGGCPSDMGTQPGSRLYKTGDLARFREDGAIEYLGRRDHQVKLRGFRIELGEIEAALAAHPAVHEVVVLAREDEPGDMRLVAYVVPQQNKEQTNIEQASSLASTDSCSLFSVLCSPQELRSYLSNLLPQYMVPSAFVLLDALPVTPNGKLDRKALPAPDRDTSRQRTYNPPRTEPERAIAEIWGALLHVEQVGREDNFFDLGGHSLLATQAVSRIREQLAVELSLQRFFTTPTIAALAEQLTSQQPGPEAALPALVPVARTADLPLSFAQQRLWFLHQLEPDSTAYVMPIAVRLRGTLAATMLERSLNAVVARHEALRTTFGMVDGRPSQIIAPHLQVPLPLLDLSAMPDEERATAAQHHTRAAACKPFDLHAGPLLRAQLIRFQADDHLLIMTLHHIIIDGWSLGVLVDELAALYRSYLTDEPIALPSLPIQYADYAVWQRQWLTPGAPGAVLERQLAYWQQQLTDLAPLDLPTDYPRPPMMTFSGAGTDLLLPLPLLHRLQALSREAGVTLFMTLLAAWQLLLQRYTRQDDIVVGSPIANRQRVELERLIGFFVNNLVLRTDLAGQPTFRQLLARVRQVCLAAYAHQDLPFEYLVQTLQPERDLSRNPLFQVMFVLQNAPLEAMELPDLCLEPVGTDPGTALFDLTLSVVETEAGLQSTLEYNTALFAPETAARLLSHYRTVLESCSANPELPIAAISLLTEAERRQMLGAWNATDAPYPQDRCIHELFAEQAIHTPDAIALVFEDVTLTYRDLDRRANQLAHYLRDLGVGKRGTEYPEVLVGVCLHRSPDLIVALLAILKAGAAYLPLDPSYPVERLAYMLADTRAPVVLTTEDLLPTLPETEATAICLDTEADRIARQPATNPPNTATPDQLAYIIYTSGSTGRSKGVLIEHRGLCNLSQTQIRHFAITPADRILQFASFSFDAAIWEIIMALLSGASLYLASAERLLPGPALIRLLRDHAITVATLPPAVLSILPETDLPDLRVIVSAGEACSSAIIERWGVSASGHERSFFNGYGPTEVTVCATISEPLHGHTTPSIGRPIANTRVYVLDHMMQPVPVGVPGELYIGGDGLARGYLHQPDLTAEKFVPNPFGLTVGARLYRTGDLVRYLPDGTIEFLGRIDHQIKVRGYRIEPGEIESRLLSHPDIREVVVLAREDIPGDMRLVAYVVPQQNKEQTNIEQTNIEQQSRSDPDDSCSMERVPMRVPSGHGRPRLCSPQELRAYLKEQLPDYMIPSAFVVLEQWPLTPNGKLDRRALPKPGTTGSPEDTARAAPRTPVEAQLTAIWQEVLGLAQVGVHDSFFDLGGHSLLATQVISRLRDVFQVELPIRQIFQAPTVADLALIVESQVERQIEPIVPRIGSAGRDGPLPLSFAQARLWFLEQLHTGSALYNIPAAARLSGRLDVSALETSMHTIIQRHESLRTAFAQVDDQPAQIIAPALSITIPVIDLHPEGTRLSADERQLQIERYVQDEAERPFVLSRPPLIRCRILRLAADEHVLLLTMHHIVSDGWSMDILVRELAAIYTATVQGVPPTVDPLPVQYADYAIWQRRWLQGTVLEAQLDYWRRQLAGIPDLIELPTDRPRPAIQSFSGAQFPFVVPARLSAALRLLSQQADTTLFMTLLAAFQTLLFRYTQQADIVVGSPIAGRTRREIEGLIGFFVNTLVLRTSLDGNPSFRHLLERAREVTLGAYAHQDLPFEQLVDALDVPRSLSHTPLFQVMFVLQNVPRNPLDLGELTLAPIATESRTAKFDLTLSLSEEEDRLSGAIEYSTDLFDATTIARMAAHFQTLLDSIVADPNRPITELKLMTEAELQQALEWNAAAQPYARPALLHELFVEQAARSPDAVAVTFEEQRLTYAELDARANRLANLLQAHGVGGHAQSETRVALCLERSLDLVVAVLAVLKAGGAYVPLDPAYPAERLRFIAEDARVALLLTQESLIGTVPTLDVPMLLLDSLATEAAPSTAPFSTAMPDHLAYVIYTSGSTGQPKGAMLSHAHVTRLFAATQPWFHFDHQDVWTLFHSIAFDFSVWELWGPLLTGGCLVVVPYWVSRTSDAFLKLLVRERVTVLNQTPTAFRALIHADTTQYSAPNLALRYIIFGGEALDLQSLAPWFARHGDQQPQLVNMYGITETTVHVTYRPLTQADVAASLGSVIGRPIPDLTLYVLDALMQPVPLGVAGELYVGGAGVARGYLHRPALTAERFVPDPFSQFSGARLYKSGDLARRLPNGDLEYLGRIDQQIKIRGFRIELGEIEAVLRRHEAVRDAVVLARTDDGSDLRLVAYLVLESDAALSMDQIRAFLLEKLPDYMVPTVFVPLPDLPLTTNGKLDRRALPKPDSNSIARSGEYVAPRTELERTLAAIWRDTLHVEQVGIHDNFFELGGHSLLATQVITRARHLTGRDVSLRLLFEAPTIAAFAAQLHCHTSAVDLPLVAAPRDGSPLPLSFAQQRLWYLDQLQPGTTLYSIPVALQLTGPLDPAVLQQSLVAIVERHAVLRTTFVYDPTADDPGPHQQIAPPENFALPVVALPPDANAATIRQIVQAEVDQPFDLARGPLFRATLLAHGADQHILVLVVHHSIFDGWSSGVLIRELSVLYHAFREHQPSPLEPLPLQYADYTLWQRQWLSGAVLEQQLDYWRRQLAAAPPLDLPTDRPRPPIASYRGAHHSFTLPAPLAAALQQQSRHLGATLFMTLLAAFQTLLSRYSGQTDITVGTPIAGRVRPELETLIGFFANTLVLRTDLSGAPSFAEVVARTRAVCLDAYAHQDVPFEVVVEHVHPTRDLSRHPLFQVMCILQNLPQDTIELVDLTLVPVSVESHTAKFDLVLAFTETPDGLNGVIEYASDLFDDATITRLVAHYQLLLAAIVTDPAQSIAALPLLTEAEQAQLRAWNATRVPYPQEHLVHRLVERQAARTPEAAAVVFGQERLSYAALDQQANQLAHLLRAYGVGPDVCVALCLERSLDLAVAVLAVLKAGGAYVPLDPAYPAERLRFMLTDSGAPVLLTHTALVDRLPQSTAQLLLLDTFATLEPYPTLPPEVRLEPEHLAYVLYTSGSTGTPKAVAMPHGPLVNLLAWQRQSTTVPPTATTLQFAALSFDVSFQEMFATWTSGGTLRLITDADRRDFAALLDLLARGEVQRLFLPFIALQHLSELAVQQSIRLHGVQEIVTAGEQLQITGAIAQMLAQLPGATLHNHYGPTETHAVTAQLLAGDPTTWPALPPIGSPIANTRIYLLDAWLQPVPIGVAGELYIGGLPLARGYLHRPDVTAERFVPDPFSDPEDAPGARMYRTGDRARYRPDGTIAYLGRIDQQVKVRGFRVEVGEIEAVLRQHPLVADAVITVWTDSEPAGAHTDTRLVAYLVLQAEAQSETQAGGRNNALRSFLGERLPEYMVPSAFVVLDRLPLTPSGKVNRRALPAPDARALPAGTAPVGPRDYWEWWLVQRWSELLHLPTVGIHDDFFALGGHSLLAVRVLAEIRQHIGRTLPLTTLLQAPTIAQMAVHLRHSEAAVAWSPLVALHRRTNSGTGSRQPFFCIHPGGGTVFCYAELARTLGSEQPFYGMQARGLEAGHTPHTTVPDLAIEYIAAMRVVQPKGPYLLGGWSFGGLVAFEMARQLREQGEEIGLLALIDSSPALSQSVPAEELDSAVLLAEFIYDLSGLSGQPLSIDLEALRQMAPETRNAFILAQAREQGIIPPDLEEDRLQRLAQVFQANMQAFQHYQPAPVDVRIDLIQAKDSIDPARTSHLDEWRRLALGGVAVRTVMGDHYTLLQKPHVGAVAEWLRDRLDDQAI